MTADEFFVARSKIRDFFEGRSATDGIQINPIMRDDTTALLVGRLYEEDADNRSFHVYRNERSATALDGFVKKTGLDFEVDLLVVFEGGDKRLLALVWKAYAKWIHERADAQSVLDILNQSASD